MCYEGCRYEDFSGECRLDDGAKIPLDGMCRINDMCAEIAELHNLVRHMYTCMNNESTEYEQLILLCESCEYDNACGNCDFERRMEALGIEVD